MSSDCEFAFSKQLRLESSGCNLAIEVFGRRESVPALGAARLALNQSIEGTAVDRMKFAIAADASQSG